MNTSALRIPQLKAKAALRLVKTHDLPREDWLAVRKRGIGSSDAAAAIGLNPYQSQLELWLIKTGRDAGLPKIDPHDEQSPAYWGHLLEPIVASHYTQRTGNRVRKINAVLQHSDPDKSWMLANIDRYCFYDRRQSLFQDDAEWEPPFSAVPMSLDANLRNTRAIGEFAARIGRCVVPQEFRVDEGPAPSRLASADYSEMAGQLRTLLRDLLRQQALRPEQIAVLSPYRHDNPQSTWAGGLNEIKMNTDMATPQPGSVRVGTIQGFKGLEADVVILAGIDERCQRHPATLYVGASRARAMLYVLALSAVEC